MQELITALTNQAQADGVQQIAVGGIISCNNKVLIIQRASGEEYLPNFWEVPSGKVDIGETLLEALSREIFEETGLKDICPTCFTTTIDYLSPKGKLARQFNFLMPCAGDVFPKVVLEPMEHQNFAWVDPILSDLNNYNMTDHIKALIVSAFMARRPS